MVPDPMSTGESNEDRCSNTRSYVIMDVDASRPMPDADRCAATGDGLVPWERPIAGPATPTYAPDRAGSGSRSPGVVACLVLCALACFLAPAAWAESQQRDYRHGVSLLQDHVKYPADFEHFAYLNPEAPKGGRLLLAATSPVTNFSGAYRSNVPDAPGIGRTHDLLLVRANDELGSVYGGLAEGIAFSADGSSLILRLREQARWHDGVAITAADVKFTFDHLMSTLFGQVAIPWIEGVDVINPHEVVIHHRDRFTTGDLLALTFLPSIRPAHYWGDRDPDERTLTPPLASGPYRVREFGSDYVIYERVEDYWGRDLAINRGRNNFDEIRYDVYLDATVAREAFRKGLFDVHYEGDLRHWTGSYDVPAVDNGWILRGSRRIGQVTTQTAIVLNTEYAPLEDVRVREALTLAMDFEWQNRVFHHGLQTRARSYFAESQFAAEGLPSQAELDVLAPFRDQLPKRLFTRPFELPTSDGMGWPRSTLLMARQLFGQAGWHVREGRLVNAHDERFQLEILTANPTLQRTLLAFIGALDVLGVDARIRLVEGTQYTNLLRRRQYQAVTIGYEFMIPPPPELKAYFHSTSADMPGAAQSSNLQAIREPAVDALILRANEATTLPAMRTACQALDRVLLWGFYSILLDNWREQRFLYWDRFGRPEREDEALYGTPGVNGWWFESAKAVRIGTGP